ncbi:hypothetical protein NKG94_10460 [Micromonospora sp. M12]
MTTTAFDDHERSRWAGRAVAYDRSLAALCAHPAPSLLEAALVGAGTRVLDAGTGSGRWPGWRVRVVPPSSPSTPSPAWWRWCVPAFRPPRRCVSRHCRTSRSRPGASTRPWRTS